MRRNLTLTIFRFFDRKMKKKQFTSGPLEQEWHDTAPFSIDNSVLYSLHHFQRLVTLKIPDLTSPDYHLWGYLK
jgi:hypothetical protein